MGKALKLVETTNEAPSETILESSPYRVLARQYRPTKLSEVIGQDTLVTVLKQGIENNRLGHAFILTGIRGTGKTTTARIIARSLNCTGLDGNGGPTPEPCGQCPSCVAIAQDRHMDVIEIDAASRTSVDDMREIIEASRYKAVSARYKIYIIDEVHMLSKSAFNALLKTLEEPPAHVKFIFATTEIHKVPQTILSRCVRFDLKRITVETLVDHFKSICAQENTTCEDEALALIAQAADGSVRDGLSLLDQAMTQGAKPEGGAVITAEAVRSMLGLSDRSQIYALFQALMEGDLSKTLDSARALYGQGSEATAILEDLLQVTHWVSSLKSAPTLSAGLTVSEMDRTQGEALSGSLSIPALGRLWQMLLKGYDEVKVSPHPLQALEMILIRIAHTAATPSVYELLKGEGSKKNS